MSQEEQRSFSREFKLAVIERLEAGESGTALAPEFSVKRTIIYRWREAWRVGGPEALRGTRGRPPKLEALAMQRARKNRRIRRHDTRFPHIPTEVVPVERPLGQDRAFRGAFG